MTFRELAAFLADQGKPLAVSRCDVMQRNAKLGAALMRDPRKAPRLARKIAALSEAHNIGADDVTAMNAAMRKRARRLRYDVAQEAA